MTVPSYLVDCVSSIYFRWSFSSTYLENFHRVSTLTHSLSYLSLLTFWTVVSTHVLHFCCRHCHLFSVIMRILTQV
jgi:hypothetical protein